MDKNNRRCAWVSDDPLYIRYHDEEWGLPRHDDSTLFEFLILEGAQAGLSWITILKKRENYRAAFARFSPEKIAGFDPAKIDILLKNPGIIRNRRKIEAAVANAKAFLKIVEKHGSFDSYLWRFVDGRPILNHYRSQAEIPSQTTLSQKMSRELNQSGFAFVGPTICYAFMQAIGMVNDHLIHCFRHPEIHNLSRR